MAVSGRGRRRCRRPAWQDGRAPVPLRGPSL